MTRRLALLLCGITLLAAACAGGSEGNAVTTGSADAGSPTADAPSTGGDDPSSGDADIDDNEAEDDADEPALLQDDGTAMAASSPIGAFFDGGFEDAIAEYTLRVEESIVVCMANQGFEFAVTGNAGGNNEIEQRQNELTTREWTTEYGFGISTSFDSIAQDQTSDPNTAIFLGMSTAEREIWVQTLTGGELGDAAGGGFNDRPLEEQGCVGQALIETGGQEAIEGLDDFGDVYEEGEAAIYDRRDMIEAVDAWARCMGEAGYPNFSELDGPETEIEAQLEVVTAPLSAALDTMTDEEGQALISGESFDIADLPDLDVEALRELQANEIAVAIADLDCYEAEVQAIFEPLRDDFENGLLVDYADEFDALKNIGS